MASSMRTLEEREREMTAIQREKERKHLKPNPELHTE